MQPRPIEDVMNEHVDRLMTTPGVVGVGIGECAGTPCIKVFVSRSTPALVAQIPDKLEGHDVMVEETGEFRPLGP